MGSPLTMGVSQAGDPKITVGLYIINWLLLGDDNWGHPYLEKIPRKPAKENS